MTKARPAPLLALLLAACTARAGTRPGTTPAPDEPSAALPDPERAPIRGERGDVLDLTLPLVDGGGLPLAGLRGRVVVLELAIAGAPGWTAAFARYNRLLREHGAGRLAVVLVAVDPERAALSPEPDLRARGFELGWDPQGALAARLQIAALPTVVVLDRAGRIAFVRGGPAAEDLLDREVREALAARVD